MQKAINEQFHELSVSVGQAVAQLKDAGEQFSRTADQAEEVAEIAALKFDKAGERALSEGQKLKYSAEETVTSGKDLVASVQREAENLLKSSEATLMELKKAGDSFAIRASEVCEKMKNSLNKTTE